MPGGGRRGRRTENERVRHGRFCRDLAAFSLLRAPDSRIILSPLGACGRRRTRGDVGVTAFPGDAGWRFRFQASSFPWGICVRKRRSSVLFALLVRGRKESCEGGGGGGREKESAVHPSFPRSSPSCQTAGGTSFGSQNNGIDPHPQNNQKK